MQINVDVRLLDTTAPAPMPGAAITTPVAADDLGQYGTNLVAQMPAG